VPGQHVKELFLSLSRHALLACQLLQVFGAYCGVVLINSIVCIDVSMSLWPIILAKSVLRIFNLMSVRHFVVYLLPKKH
jgi:hypothetical protein